MSNLPIGARVPIELIRNGNRLSVTAVRLAPRLLGAVVVSELVTNAIHHAETALILRIQPLRSGFRVVVEDDSPDVPVQPGTSGADSGYGLSIVDSLAGSWGWERTLTGKKVWFELA